ncbi:MAG: ABC transporter permease [Pseudomonadales bacterium]
MTIEIIPIQQLLIAFIPVAIVIALMWRWRLRYGNALYAVMRMLVQLLLIGFALVYIFDSESSLIVVAVLTVMVLASSWIALNTIEAGRVALYWASLLSIALGGGVTLLLITQGVLRLDPWYKASYIIPLAGMIFANSMNSISLAAERLHAELQNECPYLKARNAAFQTSMVPVINSLFAVGLVSLPGMMTGQILSGVSPFIAARYQIMVMCMIFGSAGISTVCFLIMTRNSPAFSRFTEADQ